MLLDETRICWARRSLQLKFLPGYQAFPGGRVEAQDRETVVENCDDQDLAVLIACAARECFEETGVLLAARKGDKMTAGQRASLHDDLLSARMTFAEILRHWELRLDAKDFTFAGTWTTPAFSPVRFRTAFFVAKCPPKQTPFPASGELETVDLIEVEAAWQRWQDGEILCAPPIYYTLKTLLESRSSQTDFIPELLKFAAAEGANPRLVKFNPHLTILPLRTETLPPATHTNCFIVGQRKFVVIDAAARDDDEQIALREYVDKIVADGGFCETIIVSHWHSDHIGGETVLQRHLREKHNQKVPLAAHRSTAEKLPQIKFEKLLEDGELLDLIDENGAAFKLEVLHSPGHASGHLCFYDAQFGFLLTGDNVVSAGSILVAPPDGNLRDYLYSLERMRHLPNLRLLCGSHGAAVVEAGRKIEEFIAHRLERERQILAAWQMGARTKAEIVASVYANVEPELQKFAEMSVAAHLEKLQTDGLIVIEIKT